jgi:hypothetical protein
LAALQPTSERERIVERPAALGAVLGSNLTGDASLPRAGAFAAGDTVAIAAGP